MATNQYGMASAHREYLRKKRRFFIDNLQLDLILPYMTETLSQNDEEVIRAQSTNSQRIEKLLDTLPRKGAQAFANFVVAINEIQEWIPKQIAKDLKVNLSDLLGPAEDQNPGMKRDHRKLLREYLNVFKEKLCVEKISQDLVDKGILKQAQAQIVLQPPGHPEKVEKLILDVIPKCGPDAFQSFYFVLQCNQPTLAHDFRQFTRGKYPNVQLDEGKCYQESNEDTKASGKVKEMLVVQLPENCCNGAADVVDGVAGIQLNNKSANEAIQYIKQIRPDLKPSFEDRLNRVRADVLSTVASQVIEGSCTVRDASHFLDILKEKKMRIVFRELRKADQNEIVLWMRKNFPVGSTGPMRANDESRAGEMNYNHRSEITRQLSVHGRWKKLAGHDDINLKPVDVDILEQQKATKDPGEAVLSHWEVRKGSTVGTLYDLLVDCEFYSLADLL